MPRPAPIQATLFVLILLSGLAFGGPRALLAQPGATPQRWTMSVSGPMANTPMSGSGGPSETLRGPANSVLTRMEFYERGDRPCQVRATFSTWTFDARDEPTDVSETVRTFDGCNGNGGSRQIVHVQAPNGFWALRVCQRRQNDRLKGLEVKRALLRRDGAQLRGVDASDTAWERTNCNQWQSGFTDCPGGRVAKGLRIAHEGSPLSITGLSFECGFVEGRPIPTRPARVTLSAGGRGTGGQGSTGSGTASVTGWSAPSWTSVSGETASNSAIVDVRSPRAIKGIRVSESGDRPHIVSIAPETLCIGVCPDGPEDEHISMRSGDLSIQGLGGFGQSLDLSLDDDHYITAIQVCTSGQNNRDNRRIKGLRIWGARIGSGGQLLGSGAMQEERRTNCSQWYPRLECPNGAVAVGLRGYFDGRRNDPFFTGLAMQCGRVS